MAVHKKLKERKKKNKWILKLVFYVLCCSTVQVTLLINNAGVVSGLHLLDTPDHLIERSFNVNVMAHFWVSYAYIYTIQHTYTNYLFLYRPQKHFCPKWSRMNEDTSRQSPHLLAMLALANWSITVPVNLQR